MSVETLFRINPMQNTEESQWTDNSDSMNIKKNVGSMKKDKYQLRKKKREHKGKNRGKKKTKKRGK